MTTILIINYIVSALIVGIGAIVNQRNQMTLTRGTLLAMLICTFVPVVNCIAAIMFVIDFAEGPLKSFGNWCDKPVFCKK